MNDTETETIQTVYGDVDAEVVECDSCGITVLEEDAKKFTIGDREGWACETCEDTGPAEFPEFEPVVGWNIPGILMMSLLFPVSALVAAKESSEKARFLFFTGAVGATAWTLGILWLLGVFDTVTQTGGAVPL